MNNLDIEQRIWNKPQLTSPHKTAKISSGAMASKTSMKLKTNIHSRRSQSEACLILLKRFKLRKIEMERKEFKSLFHSTLILMKRESHALFSSTEDGFLMISRITTCIARVFNQEKSLESSTEARTRTSTQSQTPQLNMNSLELSPTISLSTINWRTGKKPANLCCINMTMIKSTDKSSQLSQQLLNWLNGKLVLRDIKPTLTCGNI